MTYEYCLIFLDVPVYLLMVDISADVMSMFLHDCGLTAVELTRVTNNMLYTCIVPSAHCYSSTCTGLEDS